MGSSLDTGGTFFLLVHCGQEMPDHNWVARCMESADPVRRKPRATTAVRSLCLQRGAVRTVVFWQGAWPAGVASGGCRN